jgi:hypothetical protein
MRCPIPRRNDQSRPVPRARWRRRAGRLRPTRRLTIRAQAAGTLIALGRYLVDLNTPPRGTVCPSDHVPFDPGFGHGPAAR